MSYSLRRQFLSALVLTLIAAGCARQTALVPPDIHYGFETCADCGMIINDLHYAAALAWCARPDDPTQTATFDDIGCLLNWLRHHPNAQILATWVKDVRTEDWVKASSARYVRSQQLTTPMGSGIVAGAAKNDFLGLAVQQPVLTWTNLLNLKGPEANAKSLANHGAHSD